MADVANKIFDKDGNIKKGVTHIDIFNALISFEEEICGDIDPNYSFIECFAVYEEPIEESVKEGACCHCGKINDIGVSVCWFCGTNKPC